MRSGLAAHIGLAAVVACSAAALAQAPGPHGHKMMRHFEPPPAGTDFNRTRSTEKGLFTITIAPEKEPFERATIHSWIATIKTAAGAPVTGAKIDVDGGMPQHGHGLPTKPEMTAELGAGRYRIEGAKFNMTGWWELKLAVKTESAADRITFNLNF
jgi:YtkA-like